jgi:hypothetical protein
MRQQYSVFDDCEVHCDDPNAPPMRMQIETLFKGRRKVPVAMYIVIDGRRVAYRGRQFDSPAWISMDPERFSNCLDVIPGAGVAS